MYWILAALLFLIGTIVYIFAPVDEMREKAKKAIEKREDMQIEVKEILSSVTAKKDELLTNIESMEYFNASDETDGKTEGTAAQSERENNAADEQTDGTEDTKAIDPRLSTP